MQDDNVAEPINLLVETFNYQYKNIIMSSKSKRGAACPNYPNGRLVKGAFGKNLLERDGGAGWKRLFLANQKLEELKKNLRDLSK